MISRVAMILCSALFVEAHASADSWCGFEAGLVGTKAIGYAMPSRLAPNNTEENPYTDEAAANCSVLAYTDADRSTAIEELRSCGDFEYVPSQNIWDEKNPAASEYFAFLVYSSVNDMAEVRLQSGASRWVRHTRSYNFRFAANNDIHFGHGDSHLGSFEGSPTATTMHNSTSFDAVTEPFNELVERNPSLLESNPSIRGFFDEPVFDLLEAVKLYDPSEKQAYLDAPSWDTQFEPSYIGIKLHNDENAHQWLEAEEVLVQHTAWQLDRADVDALDISEDEKDRFKALLSKRVTSEPVRTVFFPYRSPDGTILMVLTQGAACD